jgi:hypothetical protein
LRKKAEAEKDSDSQAEEEAQKEQTQDPQVMDAVLWPSHNIGDGRSLLARPFFLALKSKYR